MCHELQWPEELITRVVRSFRGSGISAVSLKIQKRKKKRKPRKLKMFNLKSTHKKQSSCFPNAFYLHKLCCSNRPFFLWGREGKREQGGDLALVGERKVFPHGGCLVVFWFAQRFTGQSVC